MVTLEQLGWDPATAKELDHRVLKAPHIKLRSVTVGEKGDAVYCIDLRVTSPNKEYLSTTELHSMEHFLLAGFRQYLPENFLSIGIMGCQTGFYLVLLNLGDAQEICSIYERILKDILTSTRVPYTSIEECGNFKNHDLELAQNVARRLLGARSRWLEVA